MIRRAVLVLFALGAAGAVPAFGQVASGALTGVVHDQAGAAVPGATVTATNISTNASRVVVSSSAGAYTVSGLAPGEYRVDLELTGFRRERREGIHLATGETARLDIDLSVGDVREQVTVHADAMILRAERASLGTVVDHEKVVDLPLNGRTFVSLAQLAPGVALPPGTQFPRINGGRPRTNEYLFDGISVLQPEPGQVAFPPVIDAIQEFKIESNSPPAEFGRFNGGVVNLTTKAGSNSFHGDGFEFLRNEALNARNFFASTNPVKPEYRRNQFGGTMGGPIAENHTFFFVDYQGQRQDIGRTGDLDGPDGAAAPGDFHRGDRRESAGDLQPAHDGVEWIGRVSPGRRSPATRFRSARWTRWRSRSSRAIRCRPRPGRRTTSRAPAPEIDNQDQFDIRIDHRLNSRGDQIFGRLSYFHDDFLPVTPLPDGSGVTTGTLGPQDTKAWSFASNYQHVFSNRLLNEVRVGDTRRTVARTATTLSASPSTQIGIPGIPSFAQFSNTLPTFLIGGYTQLGSPSNTASNFATDVTEVADSLSWLKGRHTVKMGFDWRWERLNVIQPPSPTGSFTFNAIGSDQPGVTSTGTPLASFLLGQVQTFSIDLQQQEIRNRARVQEYFIQDDWKVSDRVTISPGLRYTLNFPSTEASNQGAVFNLQTQQLEYFGQNGNPDTARELHKLNFGPRLGITARLTDKTVVSSGYALVWIEQAGITTPFTTPAFPFLQTVTQKALDNVNPAFVLANGPTVAPIPQTATAGLGQGVFAVTQDLGSGYVQQANVSLQRELSRNTVLEVSYVASKITHVGIPDTNLNQLSADQLSLGNALLQTVPNPFYGQIPASSSIGGPTITVAQLMKPFPEYTTVSLYRNNVGTTFYQGFEVGLRQRLSHGFSYSVAYTRSVLKDDASSVFDASILTGPIANYQVADSFNREARARLLDRRHAERARHVDRVGSAVRQRARASAGRRGRMAGERLDGDDDRHAAVGDAGGGYADDELQRVRGLRHSAAESRRRPDAAGRSAHADAVVQHRGVRHRAAVHARHRVAESRARTGVPRRRPGDHPAAAGRRRAEARSPRRGVQPAEYAGVWRAERRRRHCGVWDDHLGGRSARDSAGGEDLVLIGVGRILRFPLNPPDPYFSEGDDELAGDVVAGAVAPAGDGLQVFGLRFVPHRVVEARVGECHGPTGKRGAAGIFV